MITPTSLVAFGRPHTLIGTTLQCITSYWIPIFLYSHHPFTALYTNIHILLSVWLTSLCINIWAVGLNQLMDHELDRINKPNLPLPKGIMSRREAWILTCTCGIVGVIASLLQGRILAFVIIFIMIVTTAYSMPQIFLKGSPLAAGLAIALSRGIVGHIGTFLHFSNMMYHHMYIPIFIWIFAIFTFLFGIAIAILKDVPDMQGDAEFHVRTLAVRIGGRRVFQIALLILTCGYIALTMAAMCTFTPIVSLAMATCHIAIVAALWIRFIHFSFQSKPSATYAFYMDVWKCFQLEFVVVCLAVACRASNTLVHYS